MRIRDVISNIFSKANPAQEEIARTEGTNVGSNQARTIENSYNEFEVVQNGVSMLVSACSEFDIDIKKDKKVVDGVVKNLKVAKLNQLLNYAPNPYQDIQAFRAQVFMDFILEGNIFLYWDGLHLYHLPAKNVIIVPDAKTYVSKYTYNNKTDFKPEEIIHVQDPGMDSIYRGTSRLQSALRSTSVLTKMRDFQDNFFGNGCVPGLVFETDNTLGEVAKDRTISRWMKHYNPKNGAKKPMILDSGLKLKSVMENKLSDLDFQSSTELYERKILKALGIPPILMDGGNNANIAPNLKLFYLNTVLPIVRKYTAALERFFGFDLEPITGTVSALQPELKETAGYYTSLVNGGIITPDEARVELRYEPKGGDSENIRVPANIAGSATNPDQGGKPPKDTQDNNKN
jgi:HK97 family phage portal protein